MTNQPEPETARALLWRHGLPEDVVDGALCLHAQELAALQRLRMDELDLTGQKARIVGRVVDLIDPTLTPAVSAVAPATDRATLQHAFRVSEIRDNVLRRVHGYYASLQGAFAYCETEERKQPLIDTVRFELFPAPGGTQWMIHSFYGSDDDWPEISDLVITRVTVIPDQTPADAVLSVLPASVDRAAILDDEAALIVRHCPDHGQQDQDGVWMDCHCAVAEDMRKRANELRRAAESVPAAAQERSEADA